MTKLSPYHSEFIANYLFGVVKEELTEATSIFYDKTLAPGTYIVLNALGNVIAYTWIEDSTYEPKYIVEPEPLSKYYRMN